MQIVYLRPPRTASSSLVKAWDLGPPEHQGHLPLKPGGDEVFAYVTIRHPYPRIVSTFKLQQQRGRALEFEDWVLSGFGRFSDREINGNPLGVADLCWPCWVWARWADFTVRYESRERDLIELAGILGRDVPDLNLNVNPSEYNGRSWQDYYTRETRAVVRRMLSEDFDRLGYVDQITVGMV